MVFATVAVITDDSPDVEGTVAESDVAKIGENGYGTLEDAIRDANKGDVILLKNTTLDADLNDDVVIRSEGSKLTITMKQCVDISADVALKNVEIATDHSEGMIFNTTGVKLNLTFDGVSFDASCAGRTVYIQGEATASFENSDFTNSKLVYIKDMHVPMITINSTRNVDLNVQCVGSTTGSVSIGSEIKVEDSKLGTVKIQDTKLVVLPKTELKAEKILNRGGNSSVDCMGTVVASKVTVPVKITGEGRATIDEAVASSSSEINAMIGAGMKEILIDKPEMTLDESVTIPEGVTLTIMGTLMTSATEKIINISEGASLILDGADVRVPVIVDDDAYVSIVNPKSMEVKGEATSDLFVGYGNTLVIADLTIPAGKGVYAYGIVKVQGTVNLVSGAEFNVYACGEADIEGKLNVAGTVNTAGEFNVISLVAVYNDSGNASFNVTDGTVTVESGAEFSVTKVRQSGVTATNDLVIANKAEFIVEGKLIVTGNLQGIILDKGEVVFNGTSVWGGSEDDAVTGIVIYDGVSLTITSVAGYIVVTDKGIADSEAKTNGVLNANTAVYDGNMVVLKDVKGVTVSAELDYSSKTIGNVSWKVYRSTLTVSGTVVALDETVDAAGTLVNPAVIGIENGSFPRDSGIPAKVESSFQGAVIIEDVTLAKYVILGVGGSQIKVTGTITAVAEKSAIVIREGKTTVNGSIIVGPKAVDLVGEQYIQGVKYEVQDAEANFTTFYTTLDAALGASSTAYEGKLSVFNSISVEADTTVPADITLFLSADATLSVSKEAVLKISAGALLDGTKGGISVSATLIIEDKNTGLKYNSITGMFTYQVYTENGDVATYTGIVVALKNAVSGDVITLKLGTTIDSSITVGEGVKLVVPNKVELFIGSSSKDVAVTVDGTLEIQRGGSVEKKVGTKEVTFVINGVVSDAQGDGIAFADDGIQAEDFVIFKRKVDGREVKFYSNLEYAAQNAVSGVIIVVGDVSAGDIVLTKANDADYLVLFMGGGASVNVTTLKLVDSSIKMNHDEGGVVNPEITGTVVVPSGDGEAKAEFNGTNIEYIGSEKDSEEKALFVIGGVLHGKATILSGTVNVDDVLTVGTMKSDVLTIASGATLNVPEGTHFAKKNNTESGTTYCAVGDRDYTALIIEGTLYVKNGGAFIENAEVIGEVKIEGDDSSLCNTRVIGTITALKGDETTSTIEGTIRIGSSVSIGEKPSELGASGSVVGNVSLESNYLVVYPGTDLSSAKIEWNDATEESSALVTEFYVNDILYMTVYDKNSGKTIGQIANMEKINLIGLTTPSETAMKWFTSSDFKTDANSKMIGDVEEVYTSFDVSSVQGTISSGVGLQIYLNGVSVDNYSTTGSGYKIPVGSYKVSIEVMSGYDGSKAVITFNGATVSNNGTIVFSDDGFVLTANGATPASTPVTPVIPVAPSSDDDDMGLTEYLLIVLVILAAILVVVVAIRMMRS